MMISVYLDTSDLSYLIKGRGPGGPARNAERAERLRRIMADGRVRLFVSFVHLAEMALDTETRERARAWLCRVPPVWCFTTTTEDIFRAELRGERRALDARHLTVGDLERMKVPTRMPGVDFDGVTVARFFKYVSEGQAAAERWIRRADRRARDTGAATEAGHAAARLLSGDVAWMPAWVRPIASAYLHVAPKVLRRFGGGVSFDDLGKRAHLEMRGLAWTSSLVDASERPDGSFIAGTNARRAPACALRAAIERRERRDLNRDPQSGTRFDVLHVAYGANCDVATIDKANFDATKEVRRHLSRPRLFRTGNLDAVLECVELLTG